jgi:hypothetical protein
MVTWTTALKDLSPLFLWNFIHSSCFQLTRIILYLSKG